MPVMFMVEIYCLGDGITLTKIAAETKSFLRVGSKYTVAYDIKPIPIGRSFHTYPNVLFIYVVNIHLPS